jgi:hypothetical protein
MLQEAVQYSGHFVLLVFDDVWNVQDCLLLLLIVLAWL